MKLVIERDRWLRGGEGQLFRAEDGKMCCLGFFARQCGLPEEAIEPHGEPQLPLSDGFIGPLRESYFRIVDSELDEEENAWGEEVETMTFGASGVACDLMSANDDASITDVVREQSIRAHFARVGVYVTFVDGQASPPIPGPGPAKEET